MLTLLLSLMLAEPVAPVRTLETVCALAPDVVSECAGLDVPSPEELGLFVNEGLAEGEAD